MRRPAKAIETTKGNGEMETRPTQMGYYREDGQFVVKELVYEGDVALRHIREELQATEWMRDSLEDNPLVSDREKRELAAEIRRLQGRIGFLERTPNCEVHYPV